MKTLLITIPVLNEEKTIEKHIHTLMAYLEKTIDKTIHWDVCIADNGSRDSTFSLILKLAERYPQLTYVQTDRPGVGLGLKTAWKNATHDVVGYMDLDLATDLRHLSEMISLMNEGADVVYATRLHPQARVINRSFKREITSRIFNFILQRYLKVSISDAMCGFKFLKRKHLDTFYLHGAKSDGWFFCAELVIVAKTLGFTVKELPVTWTDDQESKVKLVSLSLQYLHEMQALRHRLCKKN
jgi:glycosyltransferase involved in cell wall biosynthesis